ncbi:MAG TPA: cysteine--tRNA ligase [Devosia sp.]|nr:cysteine--tRNA ligase [Devosia sp.]
MASDLKLRLTNTLTRNKEDFVPIDPANVRMYVCGPTVYDFAHIGNARPAIVFDVLFRLLRHVYGEDHVTYVRNITDVDDKINARAARDWPDLPLNDAIRRVTETTAAQYQEDVTALGCLPPTVQPRATENIAGMQAIIGRLIANHHAYEAPQVGEVLFDVGSMPDYGALSGRDLENNLAGARVEVDSHKHNPADFVLWKRSSETEPGWDSPWGRGRPGWHIECSAMSERYLGEVFDIHAGGLDLIFPHHENELAQSRCAHGTDAMARYWLHNGFLQVEGQKMSKSLGNFITIHELLETDKFGGRSWPGEVLRLAMLMTHYREPIDFTVQRLEEAEEKLRGWQRVASAARGSGTVDGSVLDALSDDIGFHRASVAMDVIARKANRGTETAVECLAATLRFFGFAPDSLLKSAEVFDHSRIDDAVNARLAALNAKDFKRADEIRAALLAEGIQLMDSKNDAGERITKWEMKR